MRVTESRLVALSVKSISTARERMAVAQDMVSSGIRVKRPSDDPSAWATAKRTRVREVASSARGEAISLSRARLAEVDASLSTMSDMLSEAKVLAIQGRNDTLGANERQILAVQVRALGAAAAGVANSQSYDGEYLFAGTLGAATPFDVLGAYQGDAVQREIEVAPGSRLDATVPGSRLTAASGVDVLPAFEALAVALDTNNGTGIDTSIGELDTAIEQAVQMRSEAGALDSSLSRADDVRQDMEIVLADVRSRAVEADGVQAAMAMVEASRALDSAQAVSSRVLELMRL